MKVLYEDNHIIIVNKQSGEIVQGDKTGDTPLSDIVKAYLKEKYNKPGNVFLGVVHRLDRPVSGAVLFAKTSKALPRLNKLFAEHEKVKKTYWAVVSKNDCQSFLLKADVRGLMDEPSSLPTRATGVFRGTTECGSGPTKGSESPLATEESGRGLLFPLVASLLGFDGKCGMWHGAQTFLGNQLACLAADAVGLVLDAHQSGLQTSDELLGTLTLVHERLLGKCFRAFLQGVIRGVGFIIVHTVPIDFLNEDLVIALGSSEFLVDELAELLEFFVGVPDFVFFHILI